MCEKGLLQLQNFVEAGLVVHFFQLVVAHDLVDDAVQFEAEVYYVSEEVQHWLHKRVILEIYPLSYQFQL